MNKHSRKLSLTIGKALLQLYGSTDYLYHATSLQSAITISAASKLHPSKFTKKSNSSSQLAHAEFVYLAIGKQNLLAYLNSDQPSNGETIYLSDFTSLSKEWYLAFKRMSEWKNHPLSTKLKSPEIVAFNKSIKQISKNRKLDLDEDILTLLLYRNPSNDISKSLHKKAHKLGRLTSFSSENDSNKYNHFVKTFHTNKPKIIAAKIQLIETLIEEVLKTKNYNLWHSICVKGSVKVNQQSKLSIKLNRTFEFS